LTRVTARVISSEEILAGGGFWLKNAAVSRKREMRKIVL
jgi:hypothetical protein